MQLPQPDLAKFDAVSHKYVLEGIIRQGDYRRIAEIGIKQGRTLDHLIASCKGIEYYLGVDKEKRWVNEADQRHFLHSNVHVRWENSFVAASKIRDHSLDLVFIDADHSYESVFADIVAWRPKVRVGGILCGHDYGGKFDGVKKAVDLLCPNAVIGPQQVWATVIEPTVQCAIPYADDRNLGRAYNEFMQMLPEGGWGILLDHDAMFTYPEWHRQIVAHIKAHPEACFVPRTNRIKCPYMRYVLSNDTDDIAFHRRVGETLANSPHKTDDVSKEREPAGLCMVISKAAWQKVGGFPQGLHYCDRMFWLSIKQVGIPIFLMHDVYVYHWHRAAGEPIQAGEWCREHRLPNGTRIYLERQDLPAYDGKTHFDKEGRLRGDQVQRS